MEGHVLPNMMSSFDGGLFQIDGNLGMTASVAEALMQSHAGEIDLLPALPPSWSTGSARSLCARGGFELDLEWAEGQLTQATVRSKAGNNCVIRYRNYRQTFETKAGACYMLDPKLAPFIDTVFDDMPDDWVNAKRSEEGPPLAMAEHMDGER